MTDLTRTPVVNPADPDSARHRRDISDAVNRILDGKINSLGTITLAANSTATTLVDRRIGTNSMILLVAETENASTDIAVRLFIDGYTKEQAVIHHSNDANTDKICRYLVIG